MGTDRGIPTLLLTALAFAALAGLLVLLVQETQPSAPEPQEPEAQMGREARPLPQEVGNLAQAVELGRREARQWRADAKLVRLYGSELSPQGVLDRDVSTLQAVFVSEEATREGAELNGLRWLLQAGRITSEEIPRYPALDLSALIERLCDLSTMLGPEAPERIKLDVDLVASPGQGPAFLVFTDVPRWLVAVDPSTCEVLGRSTDPLPDESDGGREATDAQGTFFAQQLAEREVRRVVATCPRAADADAQVAVTFDGDGSVKKVDFLPASLGGTEIGKCIADRLVQIKIARWQRGRGYVVERLQHK